MLGLKIILFCALQLTCVLSYQTHGISTKEILPSGEDEKLDKLDKVTVTLSYDTVCPYCRNFYSTMLVPVVEKIGSSLNLYTVPIGNPSNKLDYGNRLHACAIDILGNITKAVLFNGCMMKGTSDDTAADKCGLNMGIDSKPIKICAKSEKSLKLQVKYNEMSDTIGNVFVPWPLVDGVYWTDIEFNEKKFMSYVCSCFNITMISSRKIPHGCEGHMDDTVKCHTVS